MTDQPIYLTPKQLHERLCGVYTLRTIYSWSNKPHLGPKRSKLGSRVAYKLEDVEAWEAAGQKGGAQ